MLALHDSYKNNTFIKAGMQLLPSPQVQYPCRHGGRSTAVLPVQAFRTPSLLPNRHHGFQRVGEGEWSSTMGAGCLYIQQTVNWQEFNRTRGHSIRNRNPHLLNLHQVGKQLRVAGLGSRISLDDWGTSSPGPPRTQRHGRRGWKTELGRWGGVGHTL